MTDAADIDFDLPLSATSESLEIEFKLTLALSEKSGKAKLAKEICALANHGGGWIVLGRDDDGTYPNALPDELNGVDQDSVNQISDAYLQPAPHCSVASVQPNDVPFPVVVIWVPSLDKSPICGKKNGPEEGGKTTGIRKGIHYIRKAGPKSEEISSPDEWQNVIRKCVLNDKTELLGALTTMIGINEVPNTSNKLTKLDVQSDALLAKWQKSRGMRVLEVDWTKSFTLYGFELMGAPTTDTEALKNCTRDHRSSVISRRFFDIPMSSGDPTFVSEEDDVAGIELHQTSDDHDQRFAWRLSEDQTGVELLSFWEDTDWVKGAVESKSSRKWEKGAHIWMQQQVAYLDAFLGFVDHSAAYFDFTGQVGLRVSFYGLQGRTLASPRLDGIYSAAYAFYQDSKHVTLVVSRSALAPEVRSSSIAKILQQVNKLTQGPKITPETVVRYLKSFE